jgi:hypothetical protein
MSYRQPLTPVPYARRTEPSRSLLQGKAYAPSFNTNVALTLAHLPAAAGAAMRNFIAAVMSAWHAGSARFYEVRDWQRRRAKLPDPFK